MAHVIIKLVALLIVLGGVILIFDARPITKKVFGFGDQNEGADGLKILGYMLAIVGALIFYFNA